MTSSVRSFVRFSLIFSIFLVLHDFNLSEAACPKRCQCFRAGSTTEDWIKCDSGMLTAFPRSIPRTREVVFIRDNTIQSIPSNPFGSLSRTEVQYVYLDGNSIETIADEAFSVPPDLRVISLTDNRLQEITNKLFMGANSLEELYLDDNAIVELKADVFRDMWRLKMLSLSGNHITSIETNTFAGLAEVGEFYLHGNRLGVLTAGIFAGFRDIQKIDLHDNVIHTISGTAMGSLYQLRELILRGNRLFEVKSQWFQDLLSLRILDLSHNRIAQIVNRAFAGMSNLESLDLSNNVITVMGKAKLDGLGNLMSLNLANNFDIQMREGSFGNLPNIQNLDVRNISTGMSVNMLYNEGNTSRLDQVKNLMLSGLNSFPVELLRLAPNLEYLVITDSNITTIPERGFDYNIYLKEIDMRNAGITTIEKGVLYPLRKLRMLDISHNKLSHVPDDSLLAYHRSLVICFHGNPWHCDCSISWITKWMQRRGGRWCRNSWPVCQSPPKLEGKNMWEVLYRNC